MKAWGSYCLVFICLLGIETIYRYLPDYVYDLAVDWLGNNIYWIDKHTIKVSTTDGRFRKTLISLERSSYYSPNSHRNIVLDPEKG